MEQARMKLLKIGIRFWLTLTSVLTFGMGWVMLAHAPKPKPLGSASENIIAPLPALKPLSSFSDFDSDEDGSQAQSFFNTQPGINSQFRPAFRTGGS
jgi:hypothetical protein